MKQISEIKIFNINEISLLLGITEKSVRNKFSAHGIYKYKTYGKTGKALYTEEQLKQIQGKKKLNVLYYNNLLTEKLNSSMVVNYHIYASKINNNEK